MLVDVGLVVEEEAMAAEADVMRLKSVHTCILFGVLEITYLCFIK